MLRPGKQLASTLIDLGREPSEPTGVCVGTRPSGGMVDTPVSKIGVRLERVGSNPTLGIAGRVLVRPIRAST